MLFSHIKNTSLTSVQGKAQLEYFHIKYSVLGYNFFPSLRWHHYEKIAVYNRGPFTLLSHSTEAMVGYSSLHKGLPSVATSTCEIHFTHDLLK